MIKQFKFLFCVLVFAVAWGGLTVPIFDVLGYDSGANKAVENLNKTANIGYTGNDGTNPPEGIPQSIPETIGKVVGAGLAFIGIIFFLLMIYGGFTWMMARGNDQEVDKAKTLIQSAVIGLIIVLSAYAVTAFIGGVLLK